MVNRDLWMVAAAVMLSVAPAFAQLNAAQRPAKDPYRNLFAVQPLNRDQPRVDGERTLKGARPPRQKPFVMCGTLVVPSDPSVDPKIRVGPREDGVWDTIRVVPPPACNDK